MDVLLVDDEPSIRVSLGEELKDVGYNVMLASNGRDAVNAIASRVFDVVVCDVRMPGLDGVSVLHEVRRRSPETHIILMTAYAAVPDAVSALQSGATDYLKKPFDLGDLLSRLEHIGEQRALRKEWSRAPVPEEPGDAALVGQSPAMHRLLDQVRSFGASDAPILIVGESGTGKELIASSLHRFSPRKAAPFVAMNCAAVPEALLESELFGHERGAFTGAVRRREGRFKMADGGTLLLDEVAEIPLAAQAKLLRVLQEKTFEPLGTNQTFRVDVRVLSATHRNLKDQIAKGLFREDLYYRLKVLEVRVPPLRERRGDLPLLLAHFLRRYAPARPAPAVSPQALAALSMYAFPGNVRELEHAVRHAVALLEGPDAIIDVRHLPGDITGEVSSALAAPEEVSTLGEAMSAFEREYLRRALKAHRSSKTATAEALGISRKNLWEKLKKHGLVDAQEEELPGQTPLPLPPLSRPPGRGGA